MNLDNIKAIKALDSKNMLGSLQLLSHQVEEVLEAATPLSKHTPNPSQEGKLKIPKNYQNIDKIVLLGMGGSAIGMHLIKTVFETQCKLPIEIVNHYNIPATVNSKTLVIGSSYSGSTEEVVSAVNQAKAKKAKIVVISSGGKLASFAKRNKYPNLIYTTKNNPCGSPRMGLGYSIVGQLLILNDVGVLKISKKQIKEIINTLQKYDALFGAEVKTKDNPAKLIARDLLNKSVWYVGSEHLVGNMHIAANQMNENAKRFAGYFALPELNHHLLEGMIYPASNKQSLCFFFIDSNLYYQKIQKRYDITRSVLDKNKISHVSYFCAEKTRLLQAFEVLVLGSYVSFYSAILQGIDPFEIPFVDYFKEQLTK